MKEPSLFPKVPPIDLPCGLYRTTRKLADRLGAPLLVYFHNHGDPGPGIYPAVAWKHNKASFATQGLVVDALFAHSMVLLPSEGFYRIKEAFDCCEKHCMTFAADTLVQLGYDGAGNPIVFLPRFTSAGLELPDHGTRIVDEHLAKLAPLKVMMDHEHALERK